MILIDDTLAGSSASAIHSHAITPDGEPVCGRVKRESLCENPHYGIPTCPACKRELGRDTELKMSRLRMTLGIGRS